MQLFIKTPCGTTLTMNAEPFDTGLDLKVQIFERIGINPRLMWLSAGGRIVEDEDYLDARGVRQESMVFCNLRLGGGPCEFCSANRVGGDEAHGRRRSSRTYIFYPPQ